ncbi:MAG: tRNA dimethylallyltransferase [Candidatus Wolfebacteria bacterium GW2011_GWA2_42_10]|uniref:tRNA dimethylallyltransferase n=2 Tax=Candidatus Wolfeibacteriota TaxID=1752735 RepID=A0A0G0XLM3_9BACT|nr:MAG: tRNA dimethylallyltransferase [Candidatus Wolfebacteria bacterium GW2011_GWB1_41_12]KKS25362.1 MAG: tRNA dimethylallyltransferase [Candidatus Wolfebacteria bacterium GW2011_GWA2_42_10]KKT56801.1 MAG: tRNA dimethylallyltransferase [Candidatus Wolfebacteria bacterium GW2011_GWA1_44_24]
MSTPRPRKPKIIVIVGPTASGKSDLAIKIAGKFNSEIISADSRQIYRGMDIGTAKPAKTEIRKIPHHLIDIKNPDENYTVAQYKKDCLKAIKMVLAKNKIPVLVGGTGLYIKTIADNLEIPEVKPDFQLREKLEKELKSKGLDYLYQKLIELDPEAAYIIDSKNPRRIVRALEITLKTEKPFSQQRKSGKKLFNCLKIGISLPKEKLREKINKRADKILKNGLIKEVKNLIKKYPFDIPAFDAIGYREIINYLQGKVSLDETTALIKKNTWRYAKRQITWFKKDKKIIWIDNPQKAFAICRDWLGL